MSNKREVIENILFSTGKFIEWQCTEIADAILNEFNGLPGQLDNTQLPAEVADCINNWIVTFALAYHKRKDKDIANDAAEYLSDELGMPNELTAYATKAFQAQQEIESLTNQLKKQNEVQVENMKVMRAESEKAYDELKRWKEEAKELLQPIWDFADKKLGVPLGECKVNAVMKYIQQTDKVLALYKQADKTNSDLIENAVTLLEKFISRHEAGLLPDRFIYNEIKQYLDGNK
jgi:hypothetical protein